MLEMLEALAGGSALRVRPLLSCLHKAREGRSVIVIARMMRMVNIYSVTTVSMHFYIN